MLLIFQALGGAKLAPNGSKDNAAVHIVSLLLLFGKTKIKPMSAKYIYIFI